MNNKNRKLTPEEIAKIPISTFNDDDESYKLFLPNTKYQRRIIQIKAFAKTIKQIQDKLITPTLGGKLGSRDWAYRLEGENIITKRKMDAAERLINECRKKGLLPIDFVKEDITRKFSYVEKPDRDIDEFIEKHFKILLKWVDISKFFISDFWEDKDCYIQILVEKAIIKDLFEPICDKFQIRIGNAKGWDDINSRGSLIKKFKKEAEAKEKKAVILYGGDFDIDGLEISETLPKNIGDLKDADCGEIKDLKVDKFGLTFPFIKKHKLAWIENLETGSGGTIAKRVSKTEYNNTPKTQRMITEIDGETHYIIQGKTKEGKPHPSFNLPHAQKYLKKYGVRKVELNALVKDEKSMKDARALLMTTLKKHLGEDFEEEWKIKQKEDKTKVKNKIEEYGIPEAEIDEIKEKIDDIVKKIQKIRLKNEINNIAEEIVKLKKVSSEINLKELIKLEDKINEIKEDFEENIEKNELNEIEINYIRRELEHIIWKIESIKNG